MTEEVVDTELQREEGGVVGEPSVPYHELPREECIKVEEEKTLFVEDDIYKSVETFKEQVPGLPEYVYWILFLRYNKNFICQDEVRFAEETISRLRNAMKEENTYYQKLFQDNSSNLIDCS